MSEKIEEINNTPTLEEIRAKRLEIVTELFQGKIPEEIKNSPCLCCENADWRLKQSDAITAYCKNEFDFVYGNGSNDPIIRCIEFEMALITE